MKKLLYFFIIAGIAIVVIPFLVKATTSGPLGGSTFASQADGEGVAWASPGNATSSNNVDTTASMTAASTTSQGLRVTGFNFNIPTGDTINGIQVEFERRRGTCTAGLAGIDDEHVYILKAGSVVGTDKQTDTLWATTDTYNSYGGVADLWGTTWTPADINGTTFGTELHAIIQAGEFPPAPPWSCIARVDHVRITITHTTPSGAIEVQRRRAIIIEPN